MEQYTPTALNIEELFTSFLSLYANADEALEIIRKSATTSQIAEADRVWDSIFRGFSDAVKSAQNHFDPAKREAAQRLLVIFNHYGNIARKPCDEETASIYNFLQDINSGTLAADVFLLRLDDWITQLDADNQIFEALMKNRYDENSAKTDLKIKSVRTETDRTYRDILDRLDILILINGDALYTPFVKDLNVHSEQFNNLIAQRKGRNAAKGKEDNESKNTSTSLY